MEIIFIILAAILLLVGLLGTVIPGLPGPPLSYIGLLVLQLIGRVEYSVAFFIIWGFITAAVTVMDFILPTMMTKKFGGSRYASIGSVIGLIAGIIFFPPLGILLGPFFGALVGELIHSNSKKTHSLKVAMGAFLAFFVGTGAKLIVCCMMIYYSFRVFFS